MVRARTTRRYYDLAPIARLFGLSKSTQVSWTRRHDSCPFSNCTPVLIHLWVMITHSRTTSVSTSWVTLTLVRSTMQVPSATRVEQHLKVAAAQYSCIAFVNKEPPSLFAPYPARICHVSVTLVELCDMFTATQNEPSATGDRSFFANTTRRVAIDHTGASIVGVLSPISRARPCCLCIHIHTEFHWS